MRALTVVGVLPLLALGGCGLESMFGNVGRPAHERPASAIRGAVSWSGADGSQLDVIDGDGKSLEPFDADAYDGRYEVKLPSGTYSMVRVQARAGDFVLRALVPSLGEESAVDGVDLDPRHVTEALIVEARLSATGGKLQLLTPAAYVGDGVTDGTRTLIRARFDEAGPTQDLLRMVERIMARGNPTVTRDPGYFRQPVLTDTYAVTTSPLESAWVLQNPFDYDGVAGNELDSSKFDAKLSEVAQLYDPSGCPDPTRIRLVFSVDFNAGTLNGNCGAVSRFTWTTDAPGKSMFFVGWIHKESEVQDPALNNLLGAGIPNTVPMNDGGVNGDEVAGDNIWTIAFDVPFDPAKKLRIGYKYNWGFQGAQWSGNQEWPGNSRIIQVEDVNGDLFVHRRDVYGDEATNKDLMNLNLRGNGVVSWDTVLLGADAGCVDPLGNPNPEAREQKATLHSACQCGEWITPSTIGPITKACPVGP